MSAGTRSTRSSGPQEAVVVDLAHDGRGVAHDAGKTVFIDGALPGERVTWRRTKRGRNFDEGVALEILEPSPDRVTPRCQHFDVCGGCALQHLSAARQIEFKQHQLIEALARIGHVRPQTVLPPLQAGEWQYRRRARLGARWVRKKERVVVGFRERAAPYIADLRRCEVLKPPVGELLQPLSELITHLSIRERVPQIEVAIADNAVALVFRILEPLSDADTALLQQFARTHGVQVYLQPGGYDTVAPLVVPAQGATAIPGPASPGAAFEPLVYRLPAFDLTLEFAPTDFVQVHGALNERMVERAVELLAPTSEERVLDLFCGLGNFSLPLARRAAHVTGVEGEASLVQRAAANAARNHIANTEFIVADLADEALGSAPWAQRDYDKVLLDPPRAGARAALPVVSSSGARRVVYVSCHPGTLARDAGILVQQYGFRLQAAGVMDMFPHTAHVESIALFER